MVSTVDYEELGLTPAMLTALFKRPHDRQFVIDMESSVLNFIDSSQNSLELRPMNSYYRLLSHQIAEYHHLRHVIARNNESCVILFKVEETQKHRGQKPMLKDLEPLFVNESSPEEGVPSTLTPTQQQEQEQEQDQEQPTSSSGSGKKFKILKREKSKEDNSTTVNESSSQEDLPISETRETSLLESNNSSSSVVLEEERLKKEEQYNQIRQNLFESQGNGKGNGADEEEEANESEDEDGDEKDRDVTNLDQVFPNGNGSKDSRDSKESSASYYRVKIVQDKLDTFNELKNGDSPQPDDFQTSRHSFMSNQEYQYHQKGYQNRNVRRSYHSSSNSSISNMSNDSNNNYRHKSRSGSFTKRVSFPSRRSSYNSNSEHSNGHYNGYIPQVPPNAAATAGGYSMPYMMYPPQQQVPFQPMPYPGMYPPAVPIPMDGPGSVYSASNPYMYGAPFSPGMDGMGGASGAAAGGMAPTMGPFTPNIPNGTMPMPPMMGGGMPRYGMSPYGYRYSYGKNGSGDSRGYLRRQSKNIHRSRGSQVPDGESKNSSPKARNGSESDNDRQQKGYVDPGRSLSNSSDTFTVTKGDEQLSEDMNALSI